MTMKWSVLITAVLCSLSLSACSAEYPADVDILVCECRWQIIPREIDIEAEERFNELDEIYRKDHPRPTEFNAIRKWEKERLMTLEHQVMEEIVYKRRE